MVPFDLQLPEWWLVIDTNSYAGNFERELTGWCHKLGAESVKKELYPPSCPYMEGINNYQGKLELPETEFEQIKPILIKIFNGFPRPEYVKKSDWHKFLHQTLGLPEEKKP